MSAAAVESYRYETLARMILNGWEPMYIAEAMSLPVEIVERYAKGKGPAGFQRIYDDVKGERNERLLSELRRSHRFLGMQDKAYSAIETTLTGKDQRLASDNAWRVLDEFSTPPVQKREEGGVQISARDVQVNIQATQAAEGVKKVLGEIKKMERRGDGSTGFEKHLKRGTEALPSAVREAMAVAEQESHLPVVEAEVVEVEEGEPLPPE